MQCLLIDPSVDDPADHLRLLPETGLFKPRTRKGVETERVFGLNREDLVEGRQDAYTTCCDVITSWHRKTRRGDSAGAARSAAALRREPFGDVLRALEDLGRLPYAAAALRSDELAEGRDSLAGRPRATARPRQPPSGRSPVTPRAP